MSYFQSENDEELSKAYHESFKTRSCLPLLKEELKCKIQYRRLSRGEGEMKVEFEKQKEYKVYNEFSELFRWYAYRLDSGNLHCNVTESLIQAWYTVRYRTTWLADERHNAQMMHFKTNYVISLIFRRKLKF